MKANEFGGNKGCVITTLFALYCTECYYYLMPSGQLFMLFVTEYLMPF